MKAVKSIPQEKGLHVAWKNRALRFMKAYNDHEVENMLANCTPECQVAFLPLGDAGRGNVHEVGKAIWALLIDCFPSIHNTVHTMDLADGGLRCQVNIKGQQAKDFGELTSKGNRFDEDHIFIFRFDEMERITNLQVDWNHENFVEQLTS